MEDIINRLLTDPVLFVVPHPDDEVIGCGALIYNRARLKSKSAFLYLTSGAPPTSMMTPEFRKQYRNYTTYKTIRLYERDVALTSLGVNTEDITDCDYPSRTLLYDIKNVKNKIKKIAEQKGIRIILVPPYEGGHPDHDVANFIGCRLSEEDRFDLFEYALYHAEENGNAVSQRFVKEVNQIYFYYSFENWCAKSIAIKAFESQLFMLESMSKYMPEQYRKLFRYNYQQKPNNGLVLYENYKWNIDSGDLIKKFLEY